MASYGSSDIHGQPENDATAYESSDSTSFGVEDEETWGNGSSVRASGKRAKHAHEPSQSPLTHRKYSEDADEEWLRLTRPERRLIGRLADLDNQDWAKGLYRAHVRAASTHEYIKLPLFPGNEAHAINNTEYWAQEQRELSIVSSTSEHELRGRPTKVACIDLQGRQFNAAQHDEPSDDSSVNFNSTSDMSDDDSQFESAKVIDKTGSTVPYTSRSTKAAFGLHTFPSLNETITAYITKVAKEKFQGRMSRSGSQLIGYTPSLDNELVTKQLQFMTRSIIAQFESLLANMHHIAENSHQSSRRYSWMDSETSYDDESSSQNSTRESSPDDSNTKSRRIDQSVPDSREYDSGNASTAASTRKSRGRTTKRRGSTPLANNYGRQGPNSSNSPRGTSQSRRQSVNVSYSDTAVGDLTWMSVMRAASLQNWPETVLERTNERLEKLFGKRAALIPGVGHALADYFDDHLVCPVPDCPRHVEPYAEVSDLDFHIQRKHKNIDLPHPSSTSVTRNQRDSSLSAKDTHFTDE